MHELPELNLEINCPQTTPLSPFEKARVIGQEVILEGIVLREVNTLCLIFSLQLTTVTGVPFSHPSSPDDRHEKGEIMIVVLEGIDEWCGKGTHEEFREGELPGFNFQISGSQASVALCVTSAGTGDDFD